MKTKLVSKFAGKVVAKRFKTTKHLSIVLLFVFALLSCTQKPKTIENTINWPEFMAQHDLVWEETPLQWNEGAFTGNGQVGMMIYATMNDNRLDFHMGRQDVTDHRKAPNKKTSMGVKGADLLDFSRLDIGRMYLRPAGKIQKIKVRQHLWNAEVRGTIITDLGELTFRAFTPYNRMLNVIEVSSTEKQDGKTADYTWEWKAGNPISPRALAKPESYPDIELNPKPVVSKNGDLNVCVQTLNAGGDYATVWKEVESSESASTMYLSTANEIPASGKSEVVAGKTVNDAASTALIEVEKIHRDWWHSFFQKSFLSIPDGRMESFYWIQLYKMAACSRPDGPALDLNGPFLKVTSWPGLWWNLNVQLTYWPFNTSNHLELAENYIKLIDEYGDAMLKNRFSGSTLGDYAWALHNYWLIYSYKGDWESIQNKWVPKAMDVAKIYEGKQIRNENGKIELIAMGSPEYKGFEKFENTNYNLAILRWLLNTLIESNEKAGTNLQEVAKWKQTLEDLIPYPIDENGLMIGSSQPVDMSHRHYSHLLALYPLFQLDPDSPEDMALVDKSVVHWHKIEDGKGLAGYSYTGAASLYNALGRGNDAYGIMQHFLTKQIGKGSALLLPNTFYMEGWGRNPVIETPLSGAAAIMEFLLQSWGNKIRVFPAVPDGWEEASFNDLRAQGGFLVSAARENSKTTWVKIKSEVGHPCVLKVPGWNEAIQIGGNGKVRMTKIADGEFEIAFAAGQEIIVAPSPEVQPQLKPVQHNVEEINLYGVKKGMNYEEEMVYPVPEYEY
ncbi:glycoside hydrolase family 95-like protein [uncultured Draconibacterium sp.]|uniref:glycosyl hydrolase family 95 catalytic domain-containing protein n=1 Tax=uncultured Draconibacterium sp. TaxID=1573823 RepID=UPI003260DC52